MYKFSFQIVEEVCLGGGTSLPPNPVSTNTLMDKGVLKSDMLKYSKYYLISFSTL